MRIGVLASHEGTTLQAILDAVAQGRIAGSVAIVISNNSDAGALRRAAARGVPALRLSSATHPDPDALDGAILAALAEAQADVVFLAGYMKKLGPRVLQAYRGRVLNTHPALLPKFGGRGMYGTRVHEAVLASGDSESGVSIHLVDAEYDTGPVIAQCRVPVLADDSAETLAARVQGREKELVVEVLAKMAASAKE
jgi:phosphoribosylglycinamide formyltransferase-1